MNRVLIECPDFLTRPDTEYVVTEKVHGFNARFGRDEYGFYWVGSRNQIVAEGDPDTWSKTELQGFVGFAASQVRLLDEGITLFGEWAGKGVQKGIDYGERDFYLFGVMLGETLLPYSAVEDWSDRLGINTAPRLRFTPAKAPTEAQLLTLRDRPSSIAPTNGEGIVVYAYPVPLDTHGHRLIMKVKAPAFEERTRFRDPDKGKPKELAAGVVAFAEEYCTAMRLEHVLQQVVEQESPSPWAGGDGPIDPLDVVYTGQVMRLMVEDCIREGREDYDRLTEDEQKAVGRAINPLTKSHLTAARDAAIIAA